ncbi:hypothetical protein [Thermovirga sp.]|uniref:hypothetical protein n=1 Tax=Thermovirga sp. TaxID=2699834 RepID=UPI0025FA1310|nr:hypothetical protein [Thermovirga sp.]MBO8153334.1 hypothetical protein [Thermovirga sp.]
MTGWRADALNYAFMEPLRPRSTVYVIKHLNGSLGAMYGDDYFGLKALPDTNSQKGFSREKSPENETKPRKGHKPPMDHPWRRSLNNNKGNVIRDYEDYEGYFIGDEWRKIHAAY